MCHRGVWLYRWTPPGLPLAVIHMLTSWGQDYTTHSRLVLLLGKKMEDVPASQQSEMFGGEGRGACEWSPVCLEKATWEMPGAGRLHAGPGWALLLVQQSSFIHYSSPCPSRMVKILSYMTLPLQTCFPSLILLMGTLASTAAITFLECKFGLCIPPFRLCR